MPLIDDTTVLAAGSTTRRAVKTRAAEAVTNVKDFGATGNGSDDDTAAIQAAIDWTASDNRDVIFFPAGAYIITAPLTFNVVTAHSIIFRGVGRGSRIQGNFAGFLLDRTGVSSTPSLNLIENLWFINGSTNPASGAIRWDATIGITIRNCLINGFYGVSSFTSHAFKVENCVFSGVGTLGIFPGSVGIYADLGNPGVISNCDIIGFHDGIRLTTGCSIHGCRFEQNGNGINIGTKNDGGIYAASLAVIEACSFEANDCGIWARNMYTSAISGCAVHGHSAAPYSKYGAGGNGTGANGWSTYGFFMDSYGVNNVWQACKTFGDFNTAAIRINDGTQQANVWIACEAANDGLTPTATSTKWSIGGASQSGLTFIACTPDPTA